MVDNIPKNKKSFIESLEHLATVLAIVSTILVTPKILTLSDSFMRSQLLNSYGEGLTDMFMFGWGVCCYLIVFFGMRASLIASLTAGTIAFAMKFI